MNKKIIQNIKSTILALAIIFGVGYASAAWTPAPANPPTNNTSAPVDVGGNDAGVTPYSQLKTGILTLMHLITPDLTVTNPTPSSPVTVGQVLTATDTTGLTRWQTIPGIPLMKRGSFYTNTPVSPGGQLAASASFTSSSGAQAFSYTHTPYMANDTLVIHVQGYFNGQNVSPQYYSLALFKDADTSPLAVSYHRADEGGGASVSLAAEMTAPSTQAITFKVRFACTSNPSCSFNPSNMFGGVAKSSIDVEEYGHY